MGEEKVPNGASELGALAQLRAATDDFEAIRILCDQALGRVSHVDFRDRHSLGALGADVLDSCRYALPEAVEAALASFTDELQAISRGEVTSITDLSEIEEGLKSARIKSKRPARGSALLRIAFKSNYFFIRALQDAGYRVAFQVLEKKKPPGELSASMQSASKENDPVALMLGDSAPEYLEWFEGWRLIRNRIKYGRGAAILGSFVPGSPPDDIGINLVQVTEDGGIETNLSLGTRVSQVVTAIRMSSLLLSRMTEASQTQ